MSVRYIVTYNPYPLKYGGSKWEEGHAAREDARIRDKELYNILTEIQLRTGAIQKIERLTHANFIITVEISKSGNTIIYPADIERILQERGYTVFADRGLL